MRCLGLILLGLASACDGKIEPDAFKRDQPGVRAFHDWDDALLAEADEFYRIDLDEEKAMPLRISGLEKIRHLAMRGTVPLAFGDGDGRRRLLEKRAEGWTDVPLPPLLAAGLRPVLLAADADGIVLLSRGACFWRREGGDWKDVPTPPTWPWEPRLDGQPDHVLLRGRLLAVGMDAGEWGGALATFDLHAGSWTLVDASLPVHQLHADVQGRLWAVQGLNHGVLQGILRVHEKGVWSVFAGVDAGWTLPRMSYEAMDVDAQGRPWLLGSGVGLVRWTGAGWSMATRDWPQYRFNGDLYKSDASAFRLRGESTALVAFGDAGLGLWDLRRNRLRRIPLKP